MFRCANQNSLRILAPTLAWLVSASACVHTEEPVVLDISEGPLAAEIPEIESPTETVQAGQQSEAAPTPEASAPISEAKNLVAELESEVARIEEVTGNNVSDRQLLAPVLFALRAEVAEVTGGGDRKNAHELWRQALTTSPADGRIARLIFERWARFLVRGSKEGTDATVVAEGGLAVLGGCRTCQYLSSQGLLQQSGLARRLYQLMPEHLTFAESTAATAGDPTFPPSAPPLFGAKNMTDPLMSGLAKQACVARQPHQIAAWEKWASVIQMPWRGLWNGVMAACRGEHDLAIESYDETIASLNQSAVRNKLTKGEDAALRLETVWRIIRSKRALGERESLGPDYARLMAAWQDPAVTPTSTGMNAANFALRKINDTAWAARQKSLLGDTQGAEALARAALQVINLSFSDPAFARSNYRKELADLRCEVLHFLAFRIAYERREWTLASNLTEDALATIPLSPEWSRKLQMHSVIYDFLGGQMTLARKRIETLLADSGNRRSRAFGLFWLARVLEQTGQKTESDFYLKSLLTEEPLSYYSVVAAPRAGLLAPDAWVSRFGNLAELRNRLGSVSLTNAQDIMRIIDFKGKKFEWESNRRRAEVLIRAKAGGIWARAAVSDALRSAQQVTRLDRHPELFLYLSRLAYGAGDYWQAIDLTTKLSNVVENFWEKYPEQLFVIYPFPKIQSFKTAANKKARLTLMLGVARQESSFRPEARSPAGAYGYMQLTPATARRLLAEQAPADDDAIEALLLDPRSSIRLSAVYLEQLESQFAGSEILVAAAYNAGEFAVAGWQKNRQIEDPVLFIEGIPYGETQGYVKSVLRNAAVYRQLLPLTREGLAGIKKDL